MLQGLGPLPAGASATDPRGASDEGNRSKAEGNCGVSALAAGLAELGLTTVICQGRWVLGRRQAKGGRKEGVQAPEGVALRTLVVCL